MMRKLSLIRKIGMIVVVVTLVLSVSQSACENECPSSVFNYTTGEYLLLTDACSAGENACE
jgi:hypothetical protein